MKIRDFIGFRWNGRHTSEFNILRVSDGSRYDGFMLSGVTNNTTDIPGGDGQYFYNSTFQPKQFILNCAFDNVTEDGLRDLTNWLSSRELSEIVFDEEPYKAYNVKISGQPSFKYVCFDVFDRKIKENRRIYKGELNINFIAPYPFAHNTTYGEGENKKKIKYLEDIRWLKNKSNSKEFNISGGKSGATINKDSIFSIYELNRISSKNNPTVWQILSDEKNNSQTDWRAGYTGNQTKDFHTWYKRELAGQEPFPFNTSIYPTFSKKMQLALSNSNDILFSLIPAGEDAKNYSGMKKYPLRNFGSWYDRIDFVGTEENPEVGKYVYKKRCASITIPVPFAAGSKQATVVLNIKDNSLSNPFTYFELKALPGAAETIVPIYGEPDSTYQLNTELTYKVRVLGITQEKLIDKLYFVDEKILVKGVEKINEIFKNGWRINARRDEFGNQFTGDILDIEYMCTTNEAEANNWNQIGLQHLKGINGEDRKLNFEKHDFRCDSFFYGGVNGETGGWFYSKVETNNNISSRYTLTFYRTELSLDEKDKLGKKDTYPQWFPIVKLLVPIEEEVVDLDYCEWTEDEKGNKIYQKKEGQINKNIRKLPLDRGSSYLKYAIKPLENSKQFGTDLTYDRVRWISPGYKISGDNRIDRNWGTDSLRKTLQDYFDTKNSLMFDFGLEGYESLYSNIDQWDFASGLKEKSIIYKDGEKLTFKNRYGTLEDCHYDEPYIVPRNENKDYDTNSSNSKIRLDTNGIMFRVYNPGDIETPFKLRIPIRRNLSYAKDYYFYISLQTNEKNPGCNSFKGCEDITEIKQGVRYYWRTLKSGSKDERETKFNNLYLYEKQIKDSKYSIIFISANTSKLYNLKLTKVDNVYSYSLEDYKGSKIFFSAGHEIKELYRLAKEEDLTDTKFMRFKYQDGEGTDSLREILKAYHTTKQHKVFLEIDSGKEEINIIRVNSDGEEKIPVQFLLTGGDFFKIPPKLDNLHIFVYTKNVDIDIAKKLLPEGVELNDLKNPDFTELSNFDNYLPYLFDVKGGSIDYDYLYY